MKVGFYFDTRNYRQTDCSHITEGNPGLGGSEFEILLVSYLLSQRDNGLEVWLLTSTEMHVPHQRTAVVGDSQGFCDYCREHGIQTAVIKQGLWDKGTRAVFDRSGLSIVLWDHNGMSDRRLTAACRAPHIRRIVCCGREMLDLYCDHPAALKSTYAYNIFPIKPAEWYRERISDGDNHNVVYMGSVIPPKGFHLLAKAWKRVVAKVPDAQLYVIGSGKLYNRNTELGRYGIAEKSYEDRFMPYLLDSDGQLLPSVHFMGVMGVEKFDMMGRCKVGVPNPTGVSETFCLCGIEMQLMGCGIVTVRHPAYLDTIANRQFLYQKKSAAALASHIVERLLAERDSYDRLYNFVSCRFSTDRSLRRWEHILQHIDAPQGVEPPSQNRCQAKGLKRRLLRLKLACPLFARMPTVRLFYAALGRITKRCL